MDIGWEQTCARFSAELSDRERVYGHRWGTDVCSV